MTEEQTPVEVFCSYAHEDELWLRNLEAHLSLLKRQGLISLWHDRLIAPGTDWANTIDAHLETASVILLLVSADFFASDYCYGVEMQRALDREAAGEVRVIPIIVRPVDWESVPFAHLQALPTDVKPIVSWPNKDTALADVAAGIRRVIVEELPQLTTSAPRAALPKIWNVPYPCNPFFLGRDAELFQIRQNLHIGQATALSQPQAISGLGGIGKTQLALEYAYRYHQDYTAVLWARAESTNALISSYVAIATLLRLPEREVQEQDIIVQAVKMWLQIHRRWLLILDNADDLTLLPDFLPPTLGGHLLLTTRAAATGRLAHRLEIGTLLPEQGALFLLRRSTLLDPDAKLSQAAREEQDLAVQISQELGGLPLALDQAGAYLEETGIDLTGYWNIYQQHRADLLRQRGGLVADHPASVATTWSLSFQKVEEKNPAAVDLLHLCAFLSPDAMAEEVLIEGASQLGLIIASAADSFLFNQAIEVLRSYSLVQRNPREKTISIHRLVQAVLKEAMTDQEQEQLLPKVIATLDAVFPDIDAAFPDSTKASWEKWERLLPHVSAIAVTIADHRSCLVLASLLYKTARYLYYRGQYEQAELIYQFSLNTQENILGSKHLDLLKVLHGLAGNYRQLGKYNQAEPLYERILQIMEQEPGSQSNLAVGLTNIAIFYEDWQKYEQAEVLYARALHIREHELEPEHLQVAYSLTNLANLYLKCGEDERGEQFYRRAEPLYERALQIAEQKLGSEHLLISYPLMNLAKLYQEQNRYIDANIAYERALHIREYHLEPLHPMVSDILHDIAVLYTFQGRMDEAKSVYQRTLATRNQILGVQHPKTRETRNRLIMLLHIMGQHEEADQFEATQSEP